MSRAPQERWRVPWQVSKAGEGDAAGQEAAHPGGVRTLVKFSDWADFKAQKKVDGDV